MKHHLPAFILLLGLLSAGQVLGQTDSTTLTPPRKPSIWKRWFADDAKPKKLRRVGVLPVPALGSSPETKFYGGAVAQFVFNIWRDSTTYPSNAKAEFNYSVNKQLLAELNWNFFTRQNRWYLAGHFSYTIFPEQFWGVGYDLPERNMELYSAQRINADLTVYKRLTPRYPVFAGLRLHANSMFEVDAPAGGLLAAGTITGSRGGTTWGPGVAFLYEGRRNQLNPMGGAYASISATTYNKALGGNYTWTALNADLRKYIRIPVGKRPQVVAIQLKAHINLGGTAPFHLLALLGSENDMRGYYQGRYRGAQMINWQFEYRIPLIWRLGLALWGGTAAIANDLSKLPAGQLKGTAGLGIRFLIDRKNDINLRLDYGIGNDSQGFYVGFGEAF